LRDYSGDKFMVDYTAVIRKRFLLAMSDASDAASAMDSLSRHEDPDIRRLGAAAKDLKDAIRNADAAALGKAMKSFNAMPQTNFWSSIIDDAARMVLAKALSMDKGTKPRTEMIECGVAMAAYAVSYGFAGSDETAARIREARDENKMVRWIVDGVLRRSEAQKPQEAGESAFRDRKNSKPAGKKGQRAAR
jgi:hypothetical protein